MVKKTLTRDEAITQLMAYPDLDEVEAVIVVRPGGRVLAIAADGGLDSGIPAAVVQFLMSFVDDEDVPDADELSELPDWAVDALKQIAARRREQA